MMVTDESLAVSIAAADARRAREVVRLRGLGYAEARVCTTMGRFAYERAVAHLTRIAPPQRHQMAPRPKPRAVQRSPLARTSTQNAIGVSDSSTGRSTIGPLKRAGAPAGFIVGVLECGLTLGEARSTWNALANAPQSGSRLVMHAVEQGLSRHQVCVLASALGARVSSREMRVLADAPRSREPGAAWDNGSGAAVARCKSFFGESRGGFVGWAQSEERDGRDWRESSRELVP